MNEELKNKEEQKIDNLDATLASPEAKPEGEPEVTPELDTNPTPTVEEKVEAGMTDETPSDPVPAESEIVAAPEAPAAPEVAPVVEENGVTETPARTFTQEELNDITGKTRVETRDKTFRYIYDRYGVNDEAGLDELVGNAQRYDSLQEQYNNDKKAWTDSSNARDKELADIKEQVALMQSGIDKERYEDAKLILKGKGLEVSLDNINQEMATHPEWSGKTAEEANKPYAKTGEPIETTPNEPVTKVSVLGNEPTTSTGDSEEERAMRMFRV